MPSFNIIKKVSPKETFRVKSVIGKYDLNNNKVTESFKGKIDFLKANDWQIGIIVGRSGTGKSIISKKLFKDYYFKGFNYKAESVLDDFEKKLSTKEITRMFNSVGFSSPPSWLKPYNVLSTGEKMRVDLARSLLSDNKIIVFDEFTSVVDRDIAKIGSKAVSKAIRRTNKKFVAISCHYDVINWLNPDWIFNTDKMEAEYPRGSLRQPKIKLDIYEKKGLWEIFRKYHYLDTKLNNAAIQFIGYYENKPVAFIALLHFVHPVVKNTKRIHRLVVLPDYQGVGIGSSFQDKVCEYVKSLGFDIIITTSNPALVYHFKKSNLWKLTYQGRRTGGHTKIKGLNKTRSSSRLITSWKFMGN